MFKACTSGQKMVKRRNIVNHKGNCMSILRNSLIFSANISELTLNIIRTF